MPKRGRSTYLSDYGGGLVDWPGEDFEPDWAALFPIPKCYQKQPKRPAKRARRSAKQQQQEEQQPGPTDSEDEYDGEFWISSRMAAQLHHAGFLYIDIWLNKDGDCEYWDDLPAIVEPYAKQQGWWDAFRQAAMRIVGRLEKGLLPKPNCTGEEMALHRIIELAKDFWNDGDECVQEMVKKLPASLKGYDHDWLWVSDGGFQDHDVLMLYTMPQLANRDNGVAAFMGAAYLHPEDWFKPFKPDRVNDHVR